MTKLLIVSSSLYKRLAQETQFVFCSDKSGVAGAAGSEVATGSEGSACAEGSGGAAGVDPANAASKLQKQVWVTQEDPEGLPLPDEILTMVLNFLGLKDLGTAMRTCRSFDISGKEADLRKIVLSKNSIHFAPDLVPKGLMLEFLQGNQKSFIDLVSPYITFNMTSVMVSGDTLRLSSLTMTEMLICLRNNSKGLQKISFPSQVHSTDSVKGMLMLNPKCLDLYKSAWFPLSSSLTELVSISPEIFLGWQAEQLGSSVSNLKEATLPLSLGNKTNKQYNQMALAIKTQNPDLTSLTITNDNRIDLEHALLARSMFETQCIDLKFSDGDQLLIDLKIKFITYPDAVQKTDFDLVTPQFYKQHSAQFINANLLMFACQYLGDTPPGLAIGLAIIERMVDECIENNHPEVLWQVVGDESALVFACVYLGQTTEGLAILKTMVDECIAKNPDALWTPDDVGWTVLMLACEYLGQTTEGLAILKTMVDVCIAKNPDALWQADYDDWSVLMLACEYFAGTSEGLAIIERILDACIKNGHSDVLLQVNNYGYNALLVACRCLGQTPAGLAIIKTMVEECISNHKSEALWTSNNQDKTVLDQIKGWSDSEIKQELIQKIERSRVGAVACLPAKHYSKTFKIS